MEDDQISYVSLTEVQLDQLSKGYGDEGCMVVLRKGQHSRFLQALASILELADPSDVAVAVALLDKAQAADQRAYIEALSYPYISTWANACLQQLMGINDAGQSPHVAHLNSIAAVVGYRCGLDFQISTHVRSGAVALPGLGSAFVDSEENSLATVTCAGGRLTINTENSTVTVPADPTAETFTWHGVRIVHVAHDALSASFSIDDVDPYRNYFALAKAMPPADRLDDAGSKTWFESINSAWELLATNHGEYAVGIAAGLRVLTPSAETQAPSYDRDSNCFGALVIANVNHSWLAYCILEGFQKAKATALNYILPLHRSTAEEAVHFAPWEIMPQSFRSFFESTYAAPAIIEYWRSQSGGSTELEDRLYADMLFTLWRSRLDHLHHRLQASGELTKLGQSFVRGVPHSIDVEPIEVSTELRAHARMTELDFRISWRLQNLSVAKSRLAELSIAWRSTEPCPAVGGEVSTVEYRQSLTGWRTRRWLGLRKLSNPNWFGELLENEGYLKALDSEARTLYVRLVAGEQTVIEECLAALRQSDDVEVMSVLALACRDRSDLASFVMTRYPEVVHQLRQELHLAGEGWSDPIELATWLAPAFLRPD